MFSSLGENNYSGNPTTYGESTGYTTSLKINKPKSFNPFINNTLFSNFSKPSTESNNKSNTQRPELNKETNERKDSGSFANSPTMNPLLFSTSINKNSSMKKNLNIDVNSQPTTFNYFSKNVAYNHPQTTIASSSLNKLANSRTTPMSNYTQMTNNTFEKRESFNENKLVKNISNNTINDSKKEIMSSLIPGHDGPIGFKSNSFVGVFPNSKISPSNKNLYHNSFAYPLEKKIEAPNANVVLPNQEPTKFSVKKNGVVKAYAANTNQGIVRNYNEDRVSIILNIMKPNNRGEENWPKCSFFGVYDGHGGTLCADYLRDLLHQYVIKDSNFPWNPKEALRKGFELAEKNFFSFYCENTGSHEKSGSCAIVVLIVGDMCYVANVGDSRAVMSGEGGSKVYPLSRDHKPLDEIENKRIIEAGGKIYQTKASQPASYNGDSKQKEDLIIGPYRVFPGRLSVTRTFGDVEAKDLRFGGNPSVVIAVPDIKSFKISKDHDFIVLGSDGIFDKLSSREVVQCVWDTTNIKEKNIHEQCAKGVENILKEAIVKKTIDNITVVVIGFSNFKKKIFPRSKKEKIEPKTVIKGNNNSIDTSNFNSSTNNNSSDFSNIYNNLDKKNISIPNKQIPEESEKTEKTQVHSTNEKNNRISLNPFLNSPYTKSKPEFLSNLKTSTTTATMSPSVNPLLNYKSSKWEPPRKMEKENGWEIRKDILDGKLSMND